MVRVYIHGRPQGQDIWCKSPAPDDEFYLNPFLDSKIGEDMNAVLQVDMWHQNAYYSYIHRRNVVEKGNRPNAYFAITVCFEKQYCTHVAILYELLDTIYKQLCLNNLIEKYGDQERFLVAQFQEKENVLVQITNVIQQNIEKYISNGLETIESKKDTISARIKLYSIVDVDSPQFISDCLAHRVLVSPSIMNKDRLPQELQQKIVALETQKAEVLKEKNRWQSEAEDSKEVNKELNLIQKKLENKNAELTSQIDSVKEEARKEYQKEIEDYKSKIRKLNDSAEDLKKQLNNEQSSNKKLLDQKKELNGKIESLNEQLNNEQSSNKELLGQIKNLNKKIKSLEDPLKKEQKFIPNDGHSDETDSDDDRSLEINGVAKEKKSLGKFFRCLPGQFLHLCSQLAPVVEVLNTVILILLLVLLYRWHVVPYREININDNVLDDTLIQDTIIEQSSDTINFY